MSCHLKATAWWPECDDVVWLKVIATYQRRRPPASRRHHYSSSHHKMLINTNTRQRYPLLALVLAAASWAAGARELPSSLARDHGAPRDREGARDRVRDRVVSQGSRRSSPAGWVGACT